MKCALFDTRVFVQKRCSGSTIFLHLSATSQVVGHHRGRVKGKKRKMEERSADWYANFRLESSSAIRRNGLHSAEKRANACLFVHRSYVLPHSAFRRQCLDGIFTVHSSLQQKLAIIENALKVQTDMQIFRQKSSRHSRNRSQKRIHRSYFLLHSIDNAWIIFLQYTLRDTRDHHPSVLKVQMDIRNFKIVHRSYFLDTFFIPSILGQYFLYSSRNQRLAIIHLR